MSDIEIDLSKDEKLELYHKISNNEQTLRDILSVKNDDFSVIDLDIQLIEKIEWEPIERGNYTFDVNDNIFNVDCIGLSEWVDYEIDFFEWNGDLAERYEFADQAGVDGFDITDDIGKEIFTPPNFEKWSYALISKSNSGVMKSYPNGEVKNYPQPGDMIIDWFEGDSGASPSIVIGFPEDENIWYDCEPNIRDGKLNIRRSNEGDYTVLSSTDVNIPTNQVLYREIEWVNNNSETSIEQRIYELDENDEPKESPLATVSTIDSYNALQNIDSPGFGFTDRRNQGSVWYGVGVIKNGANL